MRTPLTQAVQRLYRWIASRTRVRKAFHGRLCSPWTVSRAKVQRWIGRLADGVVPGEKPGFFHLVLRGLCGDSVLSGIGCRENAFAQLPGPLCFDGAPAKLTGELARPVSVTNDDDVGLLAELVSELL